MVHYLPVARAIAEGGGLFYAANGGAPIYLTSIADIEVHRQQLAEAFDKLKADIPELQESA